ncbi:uncharacterized protein LOC113561631 isoform X1 [Ooceraea biroi]|uniref:uncharacterized protein LOC113561631 isoform X1 n=1 Tax=Ooceraea biroi TaxID=2015173 RepID=UPI000F08FF21|nr:uncharacterized protein LOC113561631 isoform X1 [Ooceraea biroi]
MEINLELALFNKGEQRYNKAHNISIHESNSTKIYSIEERHSISSILVRKVKCCTIDELILQCNKASQVIQDLTVERNLGLQQLRKMFSKIVQMEKALRRLQPTVTKRNSNK